MEEEVFSDPSAPQQLQWGLEAMERRMTSFRVGQELICPNPSYWLGQEISELQRMVGYIQQAKPEEEGALLAQLPLLRTCLQKLSGWTRGMKRIIQPVMAEDVSLLTVKTCLKRVLKALRASRAKRPDEF